MHRSDRNETNAQHPVYTLHDDHFFFFHVYLNTNSKQYSSDIYSTFYNTMALESIVSIDIILYLLTGNLHPQGVVTCQCRIIELDFE